MEKLVLFDTIAKYIFTVNLTQYMCLSVLHSLFIITVYVKISDKHIEYWKIHFYVLTIVPIFFDLLLVLDMKI